MGGRRFKLKIAVFLVFLLAAAGILTYVFFPEEETKSAEKLVLKAATYGDLNGWSDDRFEAFLPAFQTSCLKINRLPDSRSLGADKLAGTAADWKDLCRQILALPPENSTIRSFLEKHFKAFEVSDRGNPEGLFTGYYEASLKGSLTRSDRYKNPLYLRPEELVMVNLGRFRDALKGQRIAGHVRNGELLPFPDRANIEKGALSGRDLEIVWVDSAVDSFFLHIQGSGLIELEDGSELRVGYAAQNGHPYFAIGKTLIEEGHVSREKMSMQAIRSWLDDNPDRAQDVMNKNASYIFFRILETSAPIGAQGVELTPKRSLAVDRKWMPLGIPVWLETDLVDEKTGAKSGFNRLMIAQDTGGAIRGPVRGDVFWGHGAEAYERAGSMKSPGRYWILLPNAVADRISRRQISQPTG